MDEYVKSIALVIKVSVYWKFQAIFTRAGDGAIAGDTRQRIGSVAALCDTTWTRNERLPTKN